jgi:hypothetical protein
MRTYMIHIVSVRMYACTHVYIYIHIYVCVYMYVCMFVCMYLHILYTHSHICRYIQIYIHAYTNTYICLIWWDTRVQFKCHLRLRTWQLYYKRPPSYPIISNVCIHIIHIYIRTYMNIAHINSYIHTYMHTYIHTYKQITEIIDTQM